MVLLTLIGRSRDGLPLSASTQDDEQVDRNLADYQNQGKSLLKRLKDQASHMGSVESGPMVFHYLLEQDICYLALCERTFSRRLAFSYLEDIAKEFAQEYLPSVAEVRRPYAFMEFETYINKARKSYQDSRARRHLTKLNDELQDVQKIMVQNIEDVLQRGENISTLDTKASHLSSMSKKYRSEARYLNLRASLAKKVAIVILLVLFILFVRYWVF